MKVSEEDKKKFCILGANPSDFKKDDSARVAFGGGGYIFTPGHGSDFSIGSESYHYFDMSGTRNTLMYKGKNIGSENVSGHLLLSFEGRKEIEKLVEERNSPTESFRPSSPGKI